jgi:hypothetical protein
MSVSGLLSLVVIGIDEICLTQSVAFGALKGGTQESFHHFLQFFHFYLPGNTPKTFVSTLR